MLLPVAAAGAFGVAAAVLHERGRRGLALASLFDALASLGLMMVVLGASG